MNRTLLPTALTLSVLFCQPAAAEPARWEKPSPSRAVRNLIEEFLVRDLNGDGRITREEFSPGGTAGQNRQFRRIDRNRDRSISLAEFALFRGINLPRGARPFIDAAKRDFRNLDTNRDGQLTREEVAAMGTFADGDALEAYFSPMDLDSSGGVSLDEWRAGNDYPKPGPAFGFERYIGLTLEAAQNLARKERRSSRVVRIDGEWMPVTMDYRPDRLNFSISGGIVTDVSTG